MHEDSIDINDIEYVKEIMDAVEPLAIDKKIVVAKNEYSFKTGRHFKLIDGYHRLKSKLELGGNIEVYVIDEYTIDHVQDNFYSFIESCVGKKIKFLSNNSIEVGNDIYTIKPNEGCGGCSNGWSEIEVYKGSINNDIILSSVDKKDIDTDIYTLILNNESVATVDNGYGNGYYGGDFTIIKVGDN